MVLVIMTIDHEEEVQVVQELNKQMVVIQDKKFIVVVILAHL